MRRLLTLVRSSIGQKILMATSGVVLFLWIVGHVLGNLKAFYGPEKFNRYAEFLREMGQPVLGHGQALWLLRIGILVAVVVHILAATRLTVMSYKARPVRYGHRLSPDASTYASRTMRWGGVIIVLYVVYHLLHMTLGTVHPDFVAGEAYNNLVIGLAAWPVSLTYILAAIVLGLHLYQGLWSSVQTLGVNNPTIERVRRPAAAIVSVLIAVGFISVPVAVLAGILR